MTYKINAAAEDSEPQPRRDPANDAARLKAMAKSLKIQGATVSDLEFYACMGILMEREAGRIEYEEEVSRQSLHRYADTAWKSEAPPESANTS